MNNKLFKTAVVLVTIVGMLCSFASAATINSLNCSETRDRISMNVTFAEDATRGAYIAYAAKSVEAGTEGAEEIDNNYYVLGPIVAIFQPEGSFLTLGNHGEPINPALIPEGYDYIVLKAGDNGAASTLADAEAVAIPEPVTKYTITFVDGNGTTLYEVELEEGETPVYAGETPVKEGYIFKGWSPEIVAVTGDATYTAVFEEEAAEKFTVMNGADAIELDIVDGKVTLPADTVFNKTVNSGYTFTLDSWATADGKTTYAKGEAVEVATLEGVTLYAKYVTNIMLGDVTGDKKVLALDRTHVHQMVANKTQVGKVNKTYAELTGVADLDGLMGDVTGDKKILALDRTHIHQMVANKTTVGKIGQYVYYINK